jgi:hypothetical protein
VSDPQHGTLPPPLDLPQDQRLSDQTFSRPIPRAVRDHGFALDPKILEPGDLLLFSKKKSTWAGRRIIDAQALQFGPLHACWHHAAVSGGKFEICEATLTGVKAREYWGYMSGQYDIKIRRLKGASAAERSLVAYYAATNVNAGYGFLNLLGLLQALLSGDPWATKSLIYSGVICSQLYFEACMRVGFLLSNIPSTKVSPAHLSVSPQMTDIELAWVKV